MRLQSPKFADEHSDQPSITPATIKLTSQVLQDLRICKGETQKTFWGHFGVTQATGSRYEQGAPMPKTLSIMIRLYVGGKLTDELLNQYAS